MPTPIRALLAGTVSPFTRGETSAIGKQVLHGPVRFTFSGIEGDEQADRVHHGGRDKAVHHYPFDHYARWLDAAPDHPLLRLPGAFGENISTTGLLETEVCIGDRIRCGTALLEISQAREPCWKQGDKMEWATLPKLMVRERRSGWYCRVIEEGVAEAGEPMSLVERPLPHWSVARVFGLLIAGDWKTEPEALPALRDMALLFAGWRQRAVDLIDARAQ